MDDVWVVYSVALSLVTTLLFFTIPVWLVIQVRKRVPSYLGRRKSHSVSPVKHGHRCYVEGLTRAERDVVDVLAHGLSSKEYFIFNNIILPSRGDSSTQVDHIVVSRYGIFVIESKDMKGYIRGHRDGHQWAQILSPIRRYVFQNPLHQNWGHVMALKDLLPFAKEQVHSVVVFSDRCVFKSARINNVKYIDELVDYIRSHHVQVLDEQMVMVAIGKLSYMCQAVDITHDDHVANVHALLKARTL